MYMYLLIVYSIYIHVHAFVCTHRQVRSASLGIFSGSIIVLPCNKVAMLSKRKKTFLSVYSVYAYIAYNYMYMYVAMAGGQ